MKDAYKLTLEEKIGQLFFLGFQGSRLDHETRGLLEIIRPGGFLLSQRNIESFDQIYELTTTLRGFSSAFVAVDHEGGRVDRLKQLFAPIPSMGELAAGGGTPLRNGARIIAAQLRATGFNLDFAPVLDLGLPGSIVAERTLSADSLEVARIGSVFIEELSKRGVITCGKHFPGLGGAAADPHFVLPQVRRSRRQLMQEDALPFVRLFERAGMIMVSHAHYPGLGDEKPTPASVSSRVIDGFLRKKLAYQGVVISDDLTMGAVTRLGLTPDLFLRAFEAGNDLLLFSQTTPLVAEACKTILRAARGSAVLRKRVDKSVERILTLKSRTEFVPLRFRAHLRARISRHIDKLRRNVEAVHGKTPVPDRIRVEVK